MIKTGACSILLGNEYYGGYFPIKNNKLFKITKTKDIHNEFKYLNHIRKIRDYAKYYSIPDEIIHIISPSDKFYEHIKKLTCKYNINIFDGNLYGNYIDDAGNKDLLDTIEDLNRLDFSLWNSYKSIFKLVKHITYGINYLHNNKICHLDIKPENIVINTYTKTFKIIDFGFSSMEPFSDFISNIRGTPGYFPKFFESEKITPWSPRINANDMIAVDGKLPIQKDFKLVYKIDSYCLGRVLYTLKYVYKMNKIYLCFNNEKKKENLLDNIISCLLENNVYERLTIEQCINKFDI
jgi:serine/threonine protein kinase